MGEHIDLRSSYDRVAKNYAEQYYSELAAKAFDRKLLDWFIEKTEDLGVICDMGCGPGQIARYLHDRGAKACGVDLSSEMVKQAARLNPDIPFAQGDMSALNNVADDSYGGIAAFYSIVHITRPAVVDVLRELKRVLRPKGSLLLSFHIGNETIHRDAWWDTPVSVDFVFFESAEMKNYLKAAGFGLEEVIERDPYPDEYQSRRAYIFARKP